MHMDMFSRIFVRQTRDSRDVSLGVIAYRIDQIITSIKDHTLFSIVLFFSNFEKKFLQFFSLKFSFPFLFFSLCKFRQVFHRFNKVLEFYERHQVEMISVLLNIFKILSSCNYISCFFWKNRGTRCVFFINSRARFWVLLREGKFSHC